jgi:hypothetical protein
MLKNLRCNYYMEMYGTERITMTVKVKKTASGYTNKINL